MRALARVRRSRSVPLDEQLLRAPPRVSSGSVRHALLRAVASDALQQHLEVLDASRSIVAASNRSVLYDQLQDQPVARPPARRAPGRTSRRRALPPSGSRREPAELAVAPLGVLQHEHHLEQRAVAQAALRLQLLDQLLERHVLVRVGVQDRLLARLPAAPRSAGRRTGRCAAPAC